MAQSSRAPIQDLSDKISGYLCSAVTIFGHYNFLGLVRASGRVASKKAMLYAVSVLIIACPCARGLATPTALMVGTGHVKNGTVLQEVQGCV